MKRGILEYIDWGDQWRQDQNQEPFIIDDRGTETKQGIYRKAMQLAICLDKAGCYNEPIIVLAEHCIETIWIYLGILASGNYYVPISPESKKERIEKMIAQTASRMLLGLPGQTSQFGESELETINWDELSSVEITSEYEQLLQEKRRQLPEDAPMNLIFTSGSTGEPKGIIKTHQGMILFLENYIREFGFTREDRLGNQTPFYFDASAKDIYLCLKLGCPMYILDAKYFVMPLKLAEYMREERITVIQWVPSALCMLSRFRVFDQVQLPDLKKVLFVGEVFPVGQLKLWMEAFLDTEFINLYGSSEMSGVCAYYRIPREKELQETIPIGKAFAHCELYLISDGRLVEQPGEKGELYVRSEALAKGYLQAEQRQTVFTGRPLESMPEGLYYRSGDLAMYDEDHALTFVSRGDHQIKHMGHRIELGEIEQAAQKLDGVTSACSIYEKDKIILFYVGLPPKAQMASHLKECLPSYMVPNKLIPIEQMPLNANGKTDRMALRDLIGTRRKS